MSMHDDIFRLGGHSLPLRSAYSGSMMEYVRLCVCLCRVSTSNGEYITSTDVMITIHGLLMIFLLVMPTLYG